MTSRLKNGAPGPGKGVSREQMARDARAQGVPVNTRTIDESIVKWSRSASGQAKRRR